MCVSNAPEQNHEPQTDTAKHQHALIPTRQKNGHFFAGGSVHRPFSSESAIELPNALPLPLPLPLPQALALVPVLQLAHPHAPARVARYAPTAALPQNSPILLSSFFTRRTARTRSLDHRRVIRPRLRISKAEIQGLPTGYLRASSGTIKYNRESREVCCELRRSNNSGLSLVTRAG